MVAQALVDDLDADIRTFCFRHYVLTVLIGANIVNVLQRKDRSVKIFNTSCKKNEISVKKAIKNHNSQSLSPSNLITENNLFLGH